MKFKKLLAAFAVMLGFSLFAGQAQAGYRHYNICWMQTHGVTKCAYLPEGYRISGVRKPYCNRSGWNRCRNSKVGLRLTRRVIRCLSRYMNTDSMAPSSRATIYAKARW